MKTNKLSLAWENAEQAHKWHNKGKKAEYLSGSLKLAHNNVRLKNKFNIIKINMLLVAVVIGGGLGQLVSYLIL